MSHRRAHAAEPLLPPEPGVARTLFPGCKPVIRADACPESARGAVVLLHGLTDSPYSVRHLAENYQQHGFVAVVPRLPGHGTAPGALTDVDWEAWLAHRASAVREATRLTGTISLHLVGYSQRRGAGDEIRPRRS